MSQSAEDIRPMIREALMDKDQDRLNLLMITAMDDTHLTDNRSRLAHVEYLVAVDEILVAEHEALPPEIKSFWDAPCNCDGHLN